MQRAASSRQWYLIPAALLHDNTSTRLHTPTPTPTLQPTPTPTATAMTNTTSSTGEEKKQKHELTSSNLAAHDTTGPMTSTTLNNPQQQQQQRLRSASVASNFSEFDLSFLNYTSSNTSQNTLNNHMLPTGTTQNIPIPYSNSSSSNNNNNSDQLFLNTIFNNNNGNNTLNQQQHTPPISGSFEALRGNCFGKRMRAGVSFFYFFTFF